ncbi:MAG: exo-alpha-sialidase, partial [Candidatus Fimadaptatus sp.]
IWNPTPNYNGREQVPGMGGRTPLVMASSTDDGRTWSAPRTLEDDRRAGFCYPAMFFLPDGQALAAYCAGTEEDGSCLCRLRMRKFRL